MIRKGELSNFETKRFTKDGRLLDVIYDGARIYDADNRPSGLVITLKDITQAKRAEFINQTLYRISNALHGYYSLYDLLNYINRQTRSLLGPGRAHVMLLCEALMVALGIGIKVATLPVIALGVGISVDLRAVRAERHPGLSARG